jgi:hypothetical protein
VIATNRQCPRSWLVDDQVIRDIQFSGSRYNRPAEAILKDDDVSTGDDVLVLGIAYRSGPETLSLRLVIVKVAAPEKRRI